MHQPLGNTLNLVVNRRCSTDFTVNPVTFTIDPIGFACLRSVTACKIIVVCCNCAWLFRYGRQVPGMALPTQQELASLAASLPSGSPAERVDMAYSIWCNAEIKIRYPNETDEDKYYREKDEAYALNAEYAAVPLKDFLMVIMPDKPKKAKLSYEYRIKRWEEFKMDQFYGNMNAVETIMRLNASEGIEDPKNATRAFRQWTADRAKTTRIARGRKGADARWLKADEKK